jgi:hypothetical protein
MRRASRPWEAGRDSALGKTQLRSANESLMKIANSNQRSERDDLATNEDMFSLLENQLRSKHSLFSDLCTTSI